MVEFVALMRATSSEFASDEELWLPIIFMKPPEPPLVVAAQDEWNIMLRVNICRHEYLVPKCFNYHYQLFINY